MAGAERKGRPAGISELGNVYNQFLGRANECTRLIAQICSAKSGHARMRTHSCTTEASERQAAGDRERERGRGRAESPLKNRLGGEREIDSHSSLAGKVVRLYASISRCLAKVATASRLDELFSSKYKTTALRRAPVGSAPH